MKINYNWIKELVDIKISPEKLADALSMAGLSVASFDKVGEDCVYDIEVTSNRPDWLSVRGIVHEISAVTGARLKKQVTSKNKITKEVKNSNKQSVSITIENTKDCKFYYGNVICGVKVGPSPDWLKSKLETLGLRSINNVVDITNFCLLELGQPLHAFDIDKIAGRKIMVRRAKKGESITLIDGQKKDLGEGILVIADEKRPVAVAGVMGGAETEVGISTKNILLESACFDPVLVRRGSRALGVSSDSSYRFERGVDEVTVKTALVRATELMCQLCGGSLVESKLAGTPKKHKTCRIKLDLSESAELLGVAIPNSRAKSILKNLGFGVKERSKNIFDVTVPSFRKDVNIAQDLTEELARVWGYENIPLTAATIKPFRMETSVLELLEEKSSEILVGAGLKEVITYSLIAESDYEKCGLLAPADARVLINPLSQENSILRTTLVPSLLNCISLNFSRNNKDFEIFESARIFGNNSEEPALAIAICGKKSASWLKDAVDYTIFDLKGLIEILLEQAGITNCVYEKDWSLPFAAKGSSCRVILNKETLAIFCQVSADVKRAWGIKAKEEIFIAELYLKNISRYASFKKSFSSIALFPGVVRDVSMLIDEKSPFERIKSLIESETGGLMRRMSVVETYQGREIPQGALSLTISIEYGSNNRTLTDEEVNSVHNKAIQALTNNLSVKIR